MKVTELLRRIGGKNPHQPADYTDDYTKLTARKTKGNRKENIGPNYTEIRPESVNELGTLLRDHNVNTDAWSTEMMENLYLEISQNICKIWVSLSSNKVYRLIRRVRTDFIEVSAKPGEEKNKPENTSYTQRVKFLTEVPLSEIAMSMEKATHSKPIYLGYGRTTEGTTNLAYPGLLTMTETHNYRVDVQPEKLPQQDQSSVIDDGNI